MLRGDNSERYAWLVGRRIASLSAAVFLIRDGLMKGENIHIFEEADRVGGSLDGSGNPQEGYMIRGGRMFDYEQYPATLNLLSGIPSVAYPDMTVKEEMLDFNEKVQTHAQARLIDKNGQIVDVSEMGFSNGDRLRLIELLAEPEWMLKKKRIDEFFSNHFFTTNFWYMWATMFAFQPWHSLVEFRRYIKLFMHEFPRINTLSGVKRTYLNQYDSIVLPIRNWLEEQGVIFEMRTTVTGLGFTAYADTEEQVVNAIEFIQNGELKKRDIGFEDVVLVTNGCMTESSDIGSMDRPARTLGKQETGSWALWEKLAEGRPEFGHPKAFDSDIDSTLWESFTVTCNGKNSFLRKMEAFSKNEAGTGALTTMKDSSWLLSIVIAHQPHFLNQPEDVTVFWGYGLFPDREGDYVRKKMRDCNGKEILEELLFHLNMGDYLPDMLETSICLPCMMPFITSQFMPRLDEDRPLVRPEGYHNLAFASQFTEIPEGVVFTVEYSVKCAMMAVYDLMGLKKKNIPDYYHGDEKPDVLRDSFQTLRT